MSTITADLRTSEAGNAKSTFNPPMEAVVVNSIIYSKPSFCCIEVNLGDSDIGAVPINSKSQTTKLTNGPCPSSVFQNNSMSLKQTDTKMNFDSLASPLIADNAQVYRLCTTLNGSIHHQIFDLCDNIFAMAGYFGDANNEHDSDDSFIEFGYDDGEDYGNDVVDFSNERPIKLAAKFNSYGQKKVRFNAKPTVHVMHTWNYSYRAARKGEWEMHARDRERFKLRTHRTALIINPILDREHRRKTYEKRFANIFENKCDQHQYTHHMKAVTNAVTATIIAKKVPNTACNKPNHKKERKKKRFCKMGNKHYF